MSEIDDLDSSDGKLDEILEHLEAIEELLSKIAAGIEKYGINRRKD